MKMKFTINDLRNLIPKECFEKNIFLSLYYFLRDIIAIIIIFNLRNFFFSFSYIGPLIYWNLMGFFMWCLFVIGHDCGHNSFSNYRFINFIFGLISHTPLCVPYYGWVVSHREHHLNHNNIEKDHSWKPLTGEEYNKYTVWLFRFTPLLLFLYPIYILYECNTGGFSGNHFNPWSPMFKKMKEF